MLYRLSVILGNMRQIFKNRDSNCYGNCYMDRVHGRNSIWDWLWRMNKIFPGRDEKEVSIKQRFSSCEWYIYKISSQGILFHMLTQGPRLKDHCLQLRLQEHEQKRECCMTVLLHLPGGNSHYSAHISLARSSHMILVNWKRTGKCKKQMEYWWIFCFFPAIVLPPWK